MASAVSGFVNVASRQTGLGSCCSLAMSFEMHSFHDWPSSVLHSHRRGSFRGLPATKAARLVDFQSSLLRCLILTCS
uniref:Uncharacterized protein n=1 Tax=Physcomitrium patens TaxID=3218 RepID=A0A2K1KCV1_PHYPA|nr:hypothetical protein PHYPA_010797 [Physcomitrium patens]